MAASSVDRVSLLKEFYSDILDEKNYIPERRAILRKRAGLRDKSSVVIPFSFVSRFAKGTKILESEVQQKENYEFLCEYLAQFCERLPVDLEVEEALVWVSRTYGLNPQLQTDAEHQAWASIESGVQRSFASYCMDRFQRARTARGGPKHEGMKRIKEIIHAKLEAAGMLTPEGKKKATRGRSASNQDLREDTAKNQNTEEDSPNEVDEQDCEEEQGEEEVVEEDEVVQDSLMEEDEADVEPVETKCAECPDNMDTLPMVFPEEPYTGSGPSGPGESPSTKFLKDWKIREVDGQPSLVRRGDSELEGMEEENFGRCKPLKRQDTTIDSEDSQSKEVEPAPIKETANKPTVEEKPKVEDPEKTVAKKPRSEDAQTPTVEEKPKPGDRKKVAKKPRSEDAQTPTVEEKPKPEDPEKTVAKKPRSEDAQTPTIEEKPKPEDPEKTVAKKPRSEDAQTPTVEEKPKPEDPKKAEVANTAAVMNLDSDDDDTRGTFKDASGQPLAPEQKYTTKEQEQKCNRIMDELYKANSATSRSTNEDILEAQRKMRRALKEAEGEEGEDGEDEDRVLREAEEDSEENMPKKGKSRGRGRGKGRGRGRGKQDGEKPKKKPKDYVPTYPDNQLGLESDESSTEPKDKECDAPQVEEAEKPKAAAKKTAGKRKSKDTAKAEDAKKARSEEPPIPEVEEHPNTSKKPNKKRKSEDAQTPKVEEKPKGEDAQTPKVEEKPKPEDPKKAAKKPRSEDASRHHEGQEFEESVAEEPPTRKTKGKKARHMQEAGESQKEADRKGKEQAKKPESPFKVAKKATARVVEKQKTAPPTSGDDKKREKIEDTWVEAICMVREVANSDSLFTLPDEIETALRNIDAKQPVEFTRKNFTLKAPKEIDIVPGGSGTIGVGLVTRSYFATCTDKTRIQRLNECMNMDLNVNVRRGCSLSWARHGGALKAWTIAKRVAGWEAFENASDSGEET